MTYPPTDRLHRHFRFLRVPQYYATCFTTETVESAVASLFFGSDSIGTPVMFTGSVEFGYDRDGWFTRLFPLARFF
jgi:hypothetical protein